MSTSPLELPHRLDSRKLTAHAIVETPAGSRVKLAFDPESGLYTISKMLPVGLAMPLDFGFFPSTWGGDEDPLDVMILSEAELPTGCMVKVRIVGVIEVRQGKKDQSDPSERNDRLVARLDDSGRWSHIERLDQLGERWLTELNRFFDTYKDLRGQTYEVIAVGGPDRAVEKIEEAAAAWQAKNRQVRTIQENSAST